MKKVVIVVLAIIVITVAGYFVYFFTNQKEVTDDEMAQIQIYLDEIYGWKITYDEALPEFKNINEANEEWIWDRVQQKLQKYDNPDETYAFTYTQIEKATKYLFGDKLKKEFPIDGTEFLRYDEEIKKFLASGFGLGEEDDCFIILTATKNGKKYTIEIIEYIEDHVNVHEAFENEEAKGYEFYIKNLNGEIVKTYWAEFYNEYIDNEEYITIEDREEEIKQYVLENKDRFSTKIIKLELNKNTNLLHIISSKKI